METSVYGLLDKTNERLMKIKKVINNCHDLDVDVPDQIKKELKDLGLSEESFDNEKDIMIDLPSKEYKGEYEDGLEVNIEDIPENIKAIRFVNSY